MDNLYIDKEHNTPALSFEKETGVLKAIGNSYPENAFEFYRPILVWLEKYEEDPSEKTICDFHFYYVNTSSMKQITKVLILLERISQKTEVIVRWYHDDNPDDDEVAKQGMIFARLLNNLNIEIICVNRSAKDN